MPNKDEPSYKKFQGLETELLAESMTKWGKFLAHSPFHSKKQISVFLNFDFCILAYFRQGVP
jgi:hypothetical protein